MGSKMVYTHFLGSAVCVWYNAGKLHASLGGIEMPVQALVPEGPPQKLQVQTPKGEETPEQLLTTVLLESTVSGSPGHKEITPWALCPGA